MMGDRLLGKPKYSGFAVGKAGPRAGNHKLRTFFFFICSWAARSGLDSGWASIALGSLSVLHGQLSGSCRSNCAVVREGQEAQCRGRANTVYRASMLSGGKGGGRGKSSTRLSRCRTHQRFVLCCCSCCRNDAKMLVAAESHGDGEGGRKTSEGNLPRGIDL